jgi:REP element-mobilizing transposase RayT
MSAQRQRPFRGAAHRGRAMSHTYTNLNYHLIFSTKERAPLITKPVQSRIYGYMGGVIKDLRGDVISIGGVEDHVHILCRLKTDVSLGDALRQIKGSSSKWINDELKVPGKFERQTGYAGFTVSKSRVENVIRYIEQQENHHKRTTFKEEIEDFLKRHGVEYDERYLWK